VQRVVEGCKPSTIEEKTMGFARFMASGLGRGLRVVLGLALIVWGIFVVEGTNGWIMAVVGLVPLALGASNVCIIGPLLGVPFSGKDVGKTP
jgi:hypothetical protein